MWQLTEKDEIVSDGISVHLTQKQKWIVQKLLQNNGNPVPYNELLDYADVYSKGSLQQHIKNLKGKGLPIISVENGYMWYEKEVEK